MPLENTPIKDTEGDKKNEDGSIVSILPAQKKLLADFSKSCLLKFFLTEGEKLIMVTSNAFSNDEQAEFSLVGNLIGLVCKYIFQPAEESAFMFFAASNKDFAEIDPLRKYLQVMTAIGTGGFIFAKTCGRQFILVVHTEAWASESCVALLQAYCLYCVFMALNGISEAYAYSKGNEATMATLRRLMVLNTICYISLSLYLSQNMGVIGLVYANCANMLLRSIACLAYTFK